MKYTRDIAIWITCMATVGIVLWSGKPITLKAPDILPPFAEVRGVLWGAYIHGGKSTGNMVSNNYVEGRMVPNACTANGVTFPAICSYTDDWCECTVQEKHTQK